MITNQVLRKQMGARRLERQHQARISLLGHQSQPPARISSASDAIRARSTVSTALCLRVPQSRLRFSAQPCQCDCSSQVSVVEPGFMRTPILGNAKQKLDSIWQSLSPDAQVLSILRACVS
jgi:hypothetical protein